MIATNPTGGSESEMATTQNGDDDRVGPTSRLSDDKVFHLLQNQRRRSVIRYLRDVEGTVNMRDIAEQVAAWEHEKSIRELSSDERQRVYIPLYQNHLPKLDEEGVIEYDQSRGTVKRTSLANQLEQYLLDRDEGEDRDAAEDTETDQSTGVNSPALAATGVSSLLLLLATLGAPFSSVPDLFFGVLMLVAFTTATVFQSASELI